MNDDVQPLPKEKSLVVAQQKEGWLRRVLARLLPTSNSMRDDLLETLAREESSKIFSTSERVMLQNILRLTHRRVVDIMIARAEIKAVEEKTTVGDLLQMFETTGHTRLPVYKDTLDDPKGMVLVKDLLLHMVMRSGGRGKGKAKKLNLSKINLNQSLAELSIVRPIIFVPPSMLAVDLMNRMQLSRSQIALVIDEHGGTDGLVSLEDIIEQVVGEISDEHDEDESLLIQQTSKTTWVVDARADLIRVRAKIGTKFNPEEISDEIDTIGGLVFTLAGHIPVRGEVIKNLEGYEFQIIQADSRRVRKIKIIQKQPRAKRPQKRKPRHQSA